jgi:hypothetical protein
MPTLLFLCPDTGDAALARRKRDLLPHRERLSPEPNGTIAGGIPSPTR